MSTSFCVLCNVESIDENFEWFYQKPICLLCMKRICRKIVEMID